MVKDQNRRHETKHEQNHETFTPHQTRLATQTPNIYDTFTTLLLQDCGVHFTTLYDQHAQCRRNVFSNKSVNSYLDFREQAFKWMYLFFFLLFASTTLLVLQLFDS